MCWFPSGGMCHNSCPTCGPTCVVNAPIVDANDLLPFVGRRCEVLLGGLLVRGASSNVDEESLSVFENVTMVTGPVVIADNPHLVSLSFLSSLKNAGRISVTNNRNLVDAKFPSLPSLLRTQIEFSGNFRVCPANGPMFESHPDEQDYGGQCSKLELRFVVSTNCPKESPLLLDILSTLLELDIEQVCDDGFQLTRSLKLGRSSTISNMWRCPSLASHPKRNGNRSSPR
jgi:hypothetical protein